MTSVWSAESISGKPDLNFFGRLSRYMNISSGSRALTSTFGTSTV